MGHILLNDLKAARRSKGLSRAALATLIGVDAQIVKRLETGVGSVPHLLKVMATLDYHLSGLPRAADLPTRLERKRKMMRLSLDQAAQLAKMSRTTLSHLENGKGSVRSLLRLIDALAPKVRRREPERPHWLHDPTGGRDNRFTPPEILEAIGYAFGEIDIDPCGHLDSPVIAKRRIMLAEGGDGLNEPWSGRLAYVNPPYSAMLKWLRRAYEQWQSGQVETVVCLVPARTDSVWFHDHLRPNTDIYMLRGRLRFLTSNGRGHQTPFAIMFVIFGAAETQRLRLQERVPGFWLPR